MESKKNKIEYQNWHEYWIRIISKKKKTKSTVFMFSILNFQFYRVKLRLFVYLCIIMYVCLLSVDQTFYLMQRYIILMIIQYATWICGCKRLVFRWNVQRKLGIPCRIPHQVGNFLIPNGIQHIRNIFLYCNFNWDRIYGMTL